MDRAVGVRVPGAGEKDQRRCRKLNDTEHHEDGETSGTVRPDQVRDLRNVGCTSRAGAEEACELGRSQHERLTSPGSRCAAAVVY
jgi:hypothetical protein